MALNGKLDDGQRTPGVDNGAARIKALPIQVIRQRGTRHHIKADKNALEDVEVARRNQIAENIDGLRPRRVDSRHVTKATTGIDEVAQVNIYLRPRPIDIGAVAEQRHPRIPEIAPRIVREVGRQRQQHCPHQQRAE